MNSRSLPLLLILLTISPITHCAKDIGVDPYKDTCTFFGHDRVKICKYWEGAKKYWKIWDYSWNPEKTKNMTMTELKAHCDDYFVCMENSGCYKDFVNYAKLDKCIDDTFQVGPMYFCDKTLREVLETNPGNLTECVKEKLKNKNPEKTDCLSIKQTGACYLPDVEKHCDPNFLKIFKEHLELRLFNRACGGRQRYKDWDVFGGQSEGFDFILPGWFKVSDPRRDEVYDNDENVVDSDNSTEIVID